jgi:hypothetical protein
LRMGQAARAWAQKHYAQKHVLRLVATYYMSLLEPAAAASPLRLRQLLHDDAVRHAVDTGQ